MADFMNNLQSPTDFAIFLVVGTILVVLVAFLIYLIVMKLIWRWRLKEEYDFSKILIPEGKQTGFRLSYAILGALATLLVAMVMIEKKAAVDEILIKEELVISPELVEELLRLEKSESEEGDNITSDHIVNLTAELSSKTTQEIVNGLLEANMPNAAQDFLETIVQQWKEDEPQKNYPLYFTLASLILLALYIAWYASKRWSETRSNPSPPKYIEMVKHFAYPAICIPLTMLSVSEIENTGKLAQRAMAVSLEKEANNANARVMSNEIKRAVQQTENMRNEQIDGDLSSINARLDALQNHAHGNYLRAADLDGLSGDLSRLREDFTALQNHTHGNYLQAEDLGELSGDLSILRQNFTAFQNDAERQHILFERLISDINADDIKRRLQRVERNVSGHTNSISENANRSNNNTKAIAALKTDIATLLEKSNIGLLYIETNRSLSVSPAIIMRDFRAIQPRTTQPEPIELDLTRANNSAPLQQSNRLYVLAPGSYAIKDGITQVSTLVIAKGQVQIFRYFGID